MPPAAGMQLSTAIAGGAEGAATDSEHVRVCVRLRPLSQHELQNGDAEKVWFEGSTVVCHHTSADADRPRTADYTGKPRSVGRRFAVDQCIGVQTDQEETFEKSGVKSLLDSALEGFSATVFAYGQTGSGKTYTMTGVESAAETYHPSCFDGVIPRAVRYLFEKISANDSAAVGQKISIRASFLEIYNEQVRDLWNPDGGYGSLPIREYPPGYWRGFYVEDLFIFSCENYDDMMVMLWEGMRRRAVGSHTLNADSSRSHSMLTLYVESEVLDDEGQPAARFGKISFVDLAGSERLKETQGARQQHSDSNHLHSFKDRAALKAAEMLKETGNINKSLFTLGKVISALGDTKRQSSSSVNYVPYRDSKLTKLLMDSLGGTSKALMFACCSPAASYLEETTNTLSYAMRARNIRNKPELQLDPHEAALQGLKKEVRDLRGLCGALAGGLSACAAVSECPAEIRQIIGQLSSQIDRAGKLGGTTAGVRNNVAAPSPPPSTATTPRSDGSTHVGGLSAATGPAAALVELRPQPQLLDRSGQQTTSSHLQVAARGSARMEKMIEGISTAGPNAKVPRQCQDPVIQLQEQAEQAVAAYAAAVEGGDEAALSAFVSGVAELPSSNGAHHGADCGKDNRVFSGSKPPLGNSRQTGCSPGGDRGLGWTATATDAVHVSTTLLGKPPPQSAAQSGEIAYGRRKSVGTKVCEAQSVLGAPQASRRQRNGNNAPAGGPTSLVVPRNSAASIGAVGGEAASWQSYKLDQMPARPTSADFPAVQADYRHLRRDGSGSNVGLASRTSSDADDMVSSAGSECPSSSRRSTGGGGGSCASSSSGSVAVQQPGARGVPPPAVVEQELQSWEAWRGQAAEAATASAAAASSFAAILCAAPPPPQASIPSSSNAERYSQLQAALQQAVSVEDMAAAMKDLQQFQRGKQNQEKGSDIFSKLGGVANEPLATRSVNGNVQPH